MDGMKPGWRRVKFGEVVWLNKENSKNPAADGLERYVGLEHLEPGDLRIRSWGDIADGTTFTKRFRPGQVLFGKRRAYQRKVAFADFNGICSGDIYVFEPKDTGALLPELLPFICQTDAFFDHAIGTSAGSLSPRTNWKSLAEYELALPPLEEQRRIAHLLTQLDHASEALGELREQFEILLWSAASDLLHESVVHDLALNRPVQIPKGWKLNRIEGLTQRITYGFTNPMPTTDEGPWMVTAKDVVDGRVCYESARKTSQKAYSDLLTDKSRPNVGDILVTKDGALGRVALVDQDNICINQSVARLVPNAEVHPQYLSWALRSPVMQWRLMLDVGGSAVQHLYITKIAATQLVVPEISEQVSITRELESLSAGLERCAERRSRLIEMRNKTMSETLW
jgi:type I restriction enzyme S subunit